MATSPGQRGRTAAGEAPRFVADLSIDDHVTLVRWARGLVFVAGVAGADLPTPERLVSALERRLARPGPRDSYPVLTQLLLRRLRERPDDALAWAERFLDSPEQGR